MFFVLFLLLVVFPLLFSIIFSILVGIEIYNALNPLWHRLEEGKANIEVVMNKRMNLTTSLVEIAERYVGHEQITHLQISADRTRAGQGATSGMGQAGQAMTFFAGLAANFPDLKADQTYRQLMNELTVLETEVQNKYEIYNSSVKEYHVMRTSFPSYILASALDFEDASYLESSPWYPNRAPVPKLTRP